MTSSRGFPESSGVRAGTVLAGRYIIEEQLGRGGFGLVFRARQEPLGRLVAIKVLLASTAALASDAKDRFAREAHLAMRLEHPNTVRVLDMGTTDGGLPFIVWELLRGTTLGDHIERSGPMTDAQVRRVTSQILKSLMEAHGLGVIHRDIKPANIFVTSHPGEELFVKLLDFGIAKDLAAPTSSPTLHHAVIAARGLTPAASPVMTSASQALGTPRYMAPEQLAGDSAIGPYTDLYAVGLVMAEMIAGKPVYDGESAMSLMLDRMSGRQTPLPPEVMRSPLQGVITKATAKLGPERFQTAAEMLAALGREAAPYATPHPQAPVQPLPPGRTDVSGIASAPIPSPTAPLATFRSGYAATVREAAIAHVPPTLREPKKASTPRRKAWIAVPIAAVLAAGTIGVVLMTSGETPAKKPAKRSSSALAASNAPAETGAPAAPTNKVPIAQRPIASMTGPEIKDRLVKAGFILQSEPNETKHELGRFINAPLLRGECFGAVHYFEYNRESDLEAIARSNESMGKKHTQHRVGKRMISVTITGRSGVDACEKELLDVLTR